MAGAEKLPDARHPVDDPVDHLAAQRKLQQFLRPLRRGPRVKRRRQRAKPGLFRRVTGTGVQRVTAQLRVKPLHAVGGAAGGGQYISAFRPPRQRCAGGVFKGGQRLLKLVPRIQKRVDLPAGCASFAEQYRGGAEQRADRAALRFQPGRFAAGKHAERRLQLAAPLRQLFQFFPRRSAVVPLLAEHRFQRGRGSGDNPALFLKLFQLIQPRGKFGVAQRPGAGPLQRRELLRQRPPPEKAHDEKAALQLRDPFPQRGEIQLVHRFRLESGEFRGQFVPFAPGGEPLRAVAGNRPELRSGETGGQLRQPFQRLRQHRRLIDRLLRRNRSGEAEEFPGPFKPAAQRFALPPQLPGGFQQLLFPRRSPFDRPDSSQLPARLRRNHARIRAQPGGDAAQLPVLLRRQCQRVRPGIGGQFLRRIVAQQPRKRIVQRKSSRILPVQLRDIPVEFCAGGGQLPGDQPPVGGFGPVGELHRRAELFQDIRLARFVGMQLQAERPQPDRFEAAIDHLQRRPLFRHEKHPAAQRQIVRDQIGDRLRFAGAGRAVQHETLAPFRQQHRRKLRGVGAQRAVQRLRLQQRLDFAGFDRFDPGVEFAAFAGDQVGDCRISAQLPGPAREVVPHDEFVEGEAPQRQIVVHLPTLQVAHRLPDQLQHPVHIHAGVVRRERIEHRQIQLEISPQQLQQRHIQHRILVGAGHGHA